MSLSTHMTRTHLTRTLTGALCVAALLPLVGCERVDARSAAPAQDAVVTVNGEALSHDVYRVLAGAAPGPASDAMQDEVVDRLIVMELLAQQAAALGIDRDARFAAEAELQRKTLLAQLLVQRWIAELDIDEAAIQAAYAALPTDHRFRVSQILLPDRAAADAALAELRSGATFADVARTRSVGRDGDADGDLGWLQLNQMLTPVAAVVPQLADDEVSAPVESLMGWHLLKVTAREALPKPALEDARPWLAESLQQQAIQTRIKTLRDSAHIQRADAAAAARVDG